MNNKKTLEFLDPAARARAVDILSDAIDHSFVIAKCRQTTDEVKRRFEIALSIMMEMRHDLGYSWARIADSVKPALLQKLEGGSWSPSDRNAWVTSGDSGLVVPRNMK